MYRKNIILNAKIFNLSAIFYFCRVICPVVLGWGQCTHFGSPTYRRLKHRNRTDVFPGGTRTKIGVRIPGTSYSYWTMLGTGKGMRGIWSNSFFFFIWGTSTKITVALNFKFFIWILLYYYLQVLEVPKRKSEKKV